MNERKVPLLDLKWQHEKIKDNLKLRWDKILENTAFVIGEEVKTFEENFARYCGTKYAVGVSSGTDALILAMKSLNLKEKSEVICLPTSFIASAEAIVHAGLIPKFSEIDLQTGNYDYNLLEKNITPNTSAILAVHLYGRMCDMDKILEIAKKHNLKVIEDAAQAQGAVYISSDGKRYIAGSVGNVGCFSFYPAKNLGAYGQAGGVVTNDENIYLLVKRMRDHGSLGKYDHDILGYNAKIDNIQASVLDEKLKHLDSWNEMRREVAEIYYDGLKNISQVKIVSPDNSNTISVQHSFPIYIKGDRDLLAEHLKKNNIGSNILYPRALHTFPYLQDSGCKEGDFKLAEDLQTHVLSIPIFPGQSKEDAKYVVDKIREFYDYSWGHEKSENQNIVEGKKLENDNKCDNGRKIKVGVVGYGYWSPKVINGFKNVQEASVYAVCEKDKSKHELIKSQLPNVKIYLHYKELVEDVDIDAIVVTTTVSSHYRIAKEALKAGKNVLLEKPMTEEVWEAEELISLAKDKNKILMVDHTFLYMPAVRALKKVIDSGELGEIKSIFGNRTNLGLIQKDVDVVYDLAPHDFSILDYLLEEIPEEIIKVGTASVIHKYHKKNIDSISNVTLKYKSGKFVNLFYSWLSPVKDRKVFVIGSEKMAVFDMMDKEGQLKVYDTKVALIEGDQYGPWFEYKNGNYRIVDLGKVEGDDLTRMAKEFIFSIIEKRLPMTDGEVGKSVVRSLKRAANYNKPKVARYLGNMKNNWRRILNGNLMLK